MASSLHQPKRQPGDLAPRPQSAPAPRPAGCRDIRDETASQIVKTALDLLALPV